MKEKITYRLINEQFRLGKINKAKRFISLIVILLLIMNVSSAFGAATNTVGVIDLRTEKGASIFYNVQWGMSIEEVKTLVDTDFTEDDNSILINDYNMVGLYGIIFNAYCAFDDHGLNTVIFTVSKNNAYYNNIVSHFIDIFGEPNYNENEATIWQGAYTYIDILNASSDREEIVIRFKPIESVINNETIQNVILAKLDPFGFLGDPTLIGSNIKTIIGNMVEGKDYKKEINKFELEKFKDDSFIIYDFYPDFTYMNAEEGCSIIRLYTNYLSDVITSFKYCTLWDYTSIGNLVTSIIGQCGYIKSLYGDHISCNYTSLILSTEVQSEDLTIDELCMRIMSQTQGMYSVQWLNGSHRITIDITIDPRNVYIECSVTFT